MAFLPDVCLRVSGPASLIFPTIPEVSALPRRADPTVCCHVYSAHLGDGCARQTAAWSHRQQLRLYLDGKELMGFFCRNLGRGILGRTKIPDTFNGSVKK